MRGRPGPSWKIQIAATPEVVYDYVADVTRHPEWGMDDMTVVAESPGPPAIGSRYKAEGTLRGKRNPSTVTITALERPARIELEAADARPSISGHVFTIDARDGGTLVTRRIYGIEQPLLDPLFFLIFRGVINKNFNGALEKLKARLESGAP